MENKIETVVEETEAMGVATHAGLKKGAIILGVAGVVGFIATKFVIKPVIKKIKAKKASKKAALPETTSKDVFDFDEELDGDIPKLFEDEEE